MNLPQQNFNFTSIGCVQDPDFSHCHLTYKMNGDVQQDIVTIELPEFKTHDNAIRELVKYVQRSRRKPPAHLMEKVRQTHLELQVVLQQHVNDRVGSFNRRAQGSITNVN